MFENLTAADLASLASLQQDTADTIDIRSAKEAAAFGHFAYDAEANVHDRARMRRNPNMGVGKRWSPTDRIVLLVSYNPKKPGSAGYDRFALYQPNMTVEAARAAGVRADDIVWDLNHGFIALA